MNINEIGYREKHPSSVCNTLKRCAFEFNIVNASRTSRTLEGLLDPVSKNFKSKISNQQNNGMKPSDGGIPKAIIYNHNNPVKQQLK
ncbi:hypothetical protein ACFSVN_10670 [Gracilimonas halophila]|uniref:Transposase n=1 Tax=Gracilimonas halophila TaxID=1834464 RepID=A0ABW5JLB4_9BACT